MYKILEFSYNIYPFIKKDTFQVAIRVRWCAKRREVSFITGMYAEPDKWDNDCHKAKKGTTHKFGNRQYLASEINAIISEYKQEIDAFFKQCALLSHIPTTDELKQHVNDQLRPKEQPIEKPSTKPTDMKELFCQFLSINTKEKNWSERVREKYSRHFITY